MKGAEMSHTAMRNNDPDFPSAASDEVEHLFECDADGCSAEYSGTGDFSEVWADAKDEGWRCFKAGDRWQHRCPEHTRR